ncbi:MAG: NAD(P)-binding domain-containing protein [Myxococcota bacterium]
MKIGVLGAGAVGSKISALAKAAGHDVVVGGRTGGVSFADAATHGELVILAIPFHASTETLPPLSTLLVDKIVVDATNPLNDDWSPMLLGQSTSAAEEIARLLPRTRLVKAFNTVFADVMSAKAQAQFGRKITAFIAGDEQTAVRRVVELAAGMGFQPVTIAHLAAARYLEALAHLNIALALAPGGSTSAAFIYHKGDS